MSSEKSSTLVLRIIAILAIVVGILSLLGVRPMNSRTIEVVLGSASVVAGAALLVRTTRSKPVVGPV